MSLFAVGVAVGGDHGLVDGPGDCDFGMLVGGEQGVQACPLSFGEQVGAGVQGAPGGEQWITGAAAVAVQCLLDASAALVEGFAGQAHDVEWVQHGDRVRELFGGSGFEAGEPVHRDDLHPVPPRLRPVGQPSGEHLFRAALDHVQQPGRSGSGSDRCQIDDHGDVLVAQAGVPPVGSARGAAAALLPLRFPGPPAEPAVRLSPQRALHDRLLYLVTHAGVVDGVHGVGMR